MGECGGFIKALRIIGQVLVFSYQTYALKATLAENLVRLVPMKSKNGVWGKEDKLKHN